jgi:predicted Kef-type K+ transport protein
MDPIIITFTFGLGYLMHRVGLPPLVGFLLAGFGLHSLGYVNTPLLSTVADIGVTLLLFSIGLKLKIKSLLKPEVWAGATIHMGLTLAFLGFIIFSLAHIGLNFFFGLDFATALLVAFALSFSSTVFAVKILEESGRMSSLNGRTAIGVLIVQDIVAVVYLTISTGKVPSIWALAVIGLLPVARWVFMYMMDRVGHGELQVMFGIFLALAAGAATFDMVGLKADLGALILGVLIAPHPRAKEMANSLMNVKDLLLVGFFLQIGLSGLPDASGMIAAGLLILILPLKMILYFLVFTRFKLKARTSFITTMNLSNYSEFGLIVCTLAAAGGKVDQQWLVVLAIALSISLIIASPLNKHADSLFESMRNFLDKFETKTRLPEEMPYKRGLWRISIIGMGRVGAGAYDMFRDRFGDVVIGVDYSPDTVAFHQSEGREVGQGDITDPDFWRRLPEADSDLALVVLAIDGLESKLYAARMLKKRGSQASIAAVVQFDDEIQPLLDAGVDTVFNIYSEAGAGLAAHICDTLQTFTK